MISDQSPDSEAVAKSLATIQSKMPDTYLLPLHASQKELTVAFASWTSLGLKKEQTLPAETIIKAIREGIVMGLAKNLIKKYFKFDTHLLKEDRISELCEALADEFGDDSEEALTLLLAAQQKAPRILDNLFGHELDEES